MLVGLAPRLAYPVILGRDWLDFPKVLRTVNLGTTPVPMALGGDTLKVGCEPEKDHDLDNLGREAATPPLSNWQEGPQPGH